MINLFIAGELEIISQSNISSTEKYARLELLKRMMYLNNTFDFSVIKSLYAAIMRDIELGYRKWGGGGMILCILKMQFCFPVAINSNPELICIKDVQHLSKLKKKSGFVPNFNETNVIIKTLTSFR